MKKFWEIIKSIFYYGWISIIYFVLFCIIWVSSFSFIQPNVYNFMVKTFSATTHGNENTVIVAIDDKTINETGWPWNMDLYAKVMNYFSEYTDIKAIATDIVLDSKNEKFLNSVKNISSRMVMTFIPSDTYNDESFDFKNYEDKFYNKFKINIEDKSNNIYVKYRSMMPMGNDLLDKLEYTGSSGNGIDSRSGVQIYSYPVVSINERLYPSLSLRTYLLANNTDKITLTENFIKVDDTNISIPVQNFPKTMNYIKFYDIYPNTIYSHKVYSAVDILNSYDNLKNGKKPIIDGSEFKGKTVFFGGNARGDVIGTEDSNRTPIQEAHPGVDIQATIYDNYVNNEFITRPHMFHEFLVFFVLSLIVLALVMNLSFGLSITVISGMLIGYFVTCATYLYPKGIAPDVITPAVITLATLIFGYAFKFIAENKNKEKVKNAMGKYLSKTVMKNVVQNIDNVKLGGRKAVVTVLFADIRGFTSMSEKMSAEEVSLILNEYFSAIEPIITKYNGVINKFIGDAVMAIFGDPINDEMHPMNAVLCANEMLKRVRKLRNKWMDENKPEIEIGIGINTGEVFVGNIGSETRLEYTVIGDTVNIASRIESYNKVYKTNFLIGSTTYNSVKNRVDVIKISGVTIRGKQKKMDIYEILRVNAGE